MGSKEPRLPCPTCGKEIITNRQTEVGRLIAEGYNNTAIAGILFLDIGTVERHINGLYTSLGVRDNPKAQPRVTVARHFLGIEEVKDV